MKQKFRIGNKIKIEERQEKEVYVEIQWQGRVCPPIKKFVISVFGANPYNQIKAISCTKQHYGCPSK